MKEYITKDRAKQFVCGHCNEVCSEKPCEPSACDWMVFIDKEPAADVVEVVHAKWDDNGRCTNCGGHAPYYSMASTYYASPYCFECGAKMDKEE